MKDKTNIIIIVLMVGIIIIQIIRLATTGFAWDYLTIIALALVVITNKLGDD